MLSVKDPKKVDWANMPLQECMEGNALDSYYTLKLFHLFHEKLEGMGLIDLYTKLMVPATELFGGVEYRGLDVDMIAVDELDKELQGEIDRINEILNQTKGLTAEDNLASPQVLGDILYTREGGMELYPPDRTKTKNEPSTSADTLKILLTQINEVLLDE